MFRSGGPAIARGNCFPHRTSASSNRSNCLPSLPVVGSAVVALEKYFERVSCSINAFIHRPCGAITGEVVRDAACVSSQKVPCQPLRRVVASVGLGLLSGLDVCRCELFLHYVRLARRLCLLTLSQARKNQHNRTDVC